LLDRQLRRADEHHHGRVAGGAVRAPRAMVPVGCVDVASRIGSSPERAAPALKDGRAKVDEEHGCRGEGDGQRQDGVEPESHGAHGRKGTPVYSNPCWVVEFSSSSHVGCGTMDTMSDHRLLPATCRSFPSRTSGVRSFRQSGTETTICRRSTWLPRIERTGW
jgi:hypothetical protein